MDYPDFGRRLRVLRRDTGTTMASLAELTGLDAKFLRRVENGNEPPTRMLVERLSAALRVKASHFEGPSPLAEKDPFDDSNLDVSAIDEVAPAATPPPAAPPSGASVAGLVDTVDMARAGSRPVPETRPPGRSDDEPVTSYAPAPPGYVPKAEPESPEHPPVLGAAPGGTRRRARAEMEPSSHAPPAEQTPPPAAPAPPRAERPERQARLERDELKEMLQALIEVLIQRGFFGRNDFDEALSRIRWRPRS